MNTIYMIESGRPLAMVKEHIAAQQVVFDNVMALAEELGVSRVRTDRRTGVLTSVQFDGLLQVHPEFCKPRSSNSGSYPKKGSSWEKRLAAQVGHRDPSEWISTEFGVPLSINYMGCGIDSGSAHIGNILHECGFLYLGEEGPYGMWIPDVPAYVAQYREEGYVVEEPAASFEPKIEGCRLIHKEEWDICVLQHELARKQERDPIEADFKFSGDQHD